MEFMFKIRVTVHWRVIFWLTIQSVLLKTYKNVHFYFQQNSPHHYSSHIIAVLSFKKEWKEIFFATCDATVFASTTTTSEIFT